MAPDGRVRMYIYPSPDARVPVAFCEWESADAEPESGRVYTVFSDQCGMPLAVEDDTGAIVWWASEVAPWGEVTVDAGSTIELNLRWPGHYFDPETGLHDNRFRSYDPRLGRYLQPDPIGQLGGTNVYAYASNPLVAVDVYGLDHDHKSTQSSAQSGSTKPTKRMPSKPKDPPDTFRDPQGRLRKKSGEYAEDPYTSGKRTPTHMATKKPRKPGDKGAPAKGEKYENADLYAKRKKLNDEANDLKKTDPDAAAKKQAEANKVTEQIGNEAAQQYMRKHYPNAKLRKPKPDPNDPHKPAPGQKTPQQGEFDMVYDNQPPPPDMIIVESKGGSATNSSSRSGPNGKRYQQGTQEYKDSVADNMAEKGRGEDAALGEQLKGRKPPDVEYLEVSQPIGKDGQPQDMKVSDYGETKMRGGE